jgi:hypothetical protein
MPDNLKVLLWFARKNDAGKFVSDSWCVHHNHDGLFPSVEEAERYLETLGIDKSRLEHVNDGDRISITVYPEGVR